jgi:hypothetical protein
MYDWSHCKEAIIYVLNLIFSFKNDEMYTADIHKKFSRVFTWRNWKSEHSSWYLVRGLRRYISTNEFIPIETLVKYRRTLEQFSPLTWAKFCNKIYRGNITPTPSVSQCWFLWNYIESHRWPTVIWRHRCEIFQLFQKHYLWLGNCPIAKLTTHIYLMPSLEV